MIEGLCYKLLMIVIQGDIMDQETYLVAQVNMMKNHNATTYHPWVCEAQLAWIVGIAKEDGGTNAAKRKHS